jgi:hypothetical protein
MKFIFEALTQKKHNSKSLLQPSFNLTHKLSLAACHENPDNKWRSNYCFPLSSYNYSFPCVRDQKQTKTARVCNGMKEERRKKFVFIQRRVEKEGKLHIQKAEIIDWR